MDPSTVFCATETCPDKGRVGAGNIGSFDETEIIVRYAHDLRCTGRTPVTIGSRILASACQQTEEAALL